MGGMLNEYAVNGSDTTGCELEVEYATFGGLKRKGKVAGLNGVKWIRG